MRDAESGSLVNGRGGIRTHGTLSRTHTFQACALNHSATRPNRKPASCIAPFASRYLVPHFGIRDQTSYWRMRRGGMRIVVLTDRVRFELTIPFRVCRFSRPVPSTTRPPVQHQTMVTTEIRPRAELRQRGFKTSKLKDQAHCALLVSHELGSRPLSSLRPALP